MELLYFAWLREKVGIASESVPLPDGIADVGGLLTWMADRGPGYAEAMKDLSVVRVAVNQEFAHSTDPVKDGDEVAFFPPVTGG
ncbi:MAG: molybdopterin converting factor subunit 1 [Alphaproteobacteria bacterium]|jgi:sulfur-carrier protein|nr:molybdopterin converting factor subunit 1 [Alphaproteobacteria bacterium]MBT5859552.1 molybdopterin converting factor subunit 1 [Alphaproteobacteria bacterium]MBT7706753.1 molybdopterin converting factor subunit 1 [archaeon]